MDGVKRDAERQLQKQILKDYPLARAHARRKLVRALIAEAVKNLTQEANAECQ